MKKFLVLLGVILLGTAAFADVMYVETNLNMDNFWEKNGKDEQKVLNIGHRIKKNTDYNEPQHYRNKCNFPDF